MRVRGFATLAGVVATVASAWIGSAATSGDVSVRLFQFRPGNLDVRAGTSVTWTNQDDIAHTVTSGTPDGRGAAFNARLEGKGATATVEFATPGVYPYFCDRHQAMRGEIRVN